MKTAIFIFLSFFLMSCQPLLYRLAGMRNDEAVTEKQIEKFALNNNIKKHSFKILVDSIYIAQLKFIKSESPKFSKQFTPPVGLIAYDAENRIEAMISPSYVDCSFRMEWNRYGSFDAFPIKNVVTELDELDAESPIRNLEFLTSTFSGLSGNPDKDKILNDTNDKLIVFWSYGMYAHSIKLIELVQQYQKQNPTKTISIYYVNMDFSVCRTEGSLQ